MRRFILGNRAFLTSLFFVVMMQLLVAFSTYCISKLAQSVAHGSLNVGYLFGFVGSLVGVFIPAYLGSIYFERATFDALLRYHDDFERHFLGKACHYHDGNLTQNAKALLSQEAKLTLDDTLLTIYDLTSLIFNVGFNLFVIAWVIDGRILWGYAVGFVLALGVVWLFKNRLSTSATVAQNTRLSVLSALSYAWDNIIIFNTYNHTRHRHKVNDSLAAAKRAVVRAKLIHHVSANLGMLSLMSSALGVTAWLFWQHHHNIAMLAVLVATLPRQIQMLQMCEAIIAYQANLMALSARVDGLLGIFKTPKISLANFIQSDKILVKQTGRVFDLTKLLDNPPRTGRITLVGDNGVGKSCVLLTIKERLYAKSYYLPAKHELCFDNNFGSTGQRLMSEIDELTHDDTPYFCLMNGTLI
ncbi:hypothetical protein LU293_02440 [Moraxella nasovis]|uniref:hypothetical protein n=1 Tax=Moraxella nasovis TaxID=2904121 RepID=UPI001F61B7AA|nr:hypothetical protein [Moraxella nasovis]UNU73781.1 hypothetical protein LU293_02440 [Moraxella nasovis]